MTALGGKETPRLADVLGSLSLVTDLAAGVPSESSLKTCAVAAELGRRLQLPDDDRADAYYTSLLRHLGCTAFSHEAAQLGAGDDHHFLQTFEDVDPTNLAATGARAVRRLARHARPGARAAAVTRVVTSPGTAAALARAQCSQAAALASDIAMSPRVVRALGQIYEHWGGGGPQGLAGEEIELAARLLHVANVVEIQHRHGGRARAEDQVRRRAGRHLDPRLCRAFLADSATFWALLEPTSIWEIFLELEPGAPKRVEAETRGDVALAFASFADLKIPSKVGHSRAVAALAERAGRVSALPADELATLRLAALLHDLGVVGVPNGVWEKPGALNPSEWERVRLHAYFTQRVLARVPGLERVAEVASLDHERCDGSGYPRATPLPESARSGRILAAADVYCALLEPRPYRPARDGAAAADVLRDEARAGRLSAHAVDCVLAATGKGPPPPATPPASVTEREVDVLVALARGWTNKEIGVALGISAKTVQHHLARIYEKLGVSTRAGAALVAVRSQLLPQP
jgi:HD-GYP domain-containing protein (c-di-GMP phosphodiesterase class II)